MCRGILFILSRKNTEKSDYDNDGGFTDNNSRIVTATTEKPHGNDKSISNKAILDNLKLGETYVYRLGGKDTFSDKVYSFKTYDATNLTYQDCVDIINDPNNASKKRSKKS